jgi:hypothetical protein
VNVDECQRDVFNKFPNIVHSHRLGIIVMKISKIDLVMKVPKHNRGFIFKA